MRRQHDFEVSEKERLGPHLTEFKKHPIENLMENAKKKWDEKVARQSKTAEEAIEEYKRRYKRDPPYGFTEWFAYAKCKRGPGDLTGQPSLCSHSAKADHLLTFSIYSCRKRPC